MQNKVNMNLSNITKDTDVSQLLEELKTGVKEFMTSEKYQEYLDFQSSLYNYSFNNCILIAMQKPEASMIGSFNFWKNNNRYVNKGEKGIKIIAPNTSKRKVDIPTYDVNNKPIIDKDGKSVTDTVERTVITGFRLVSVFDVSQTSGEPLPNILKELSGNSSEAEKLIETIKKVSSVPINFEEIRSGAKGYYSPKESKIVINENMSNDQTAKTLIHEYTHSKLHNDLTEYNLDRSAAEIQAESTAYVVSKHFGLDTSEYSFAYVTSWANGKDLAELQNTLKVINDTSKIIINEIEDKLSAEYEKLEEKSKDNIKAAVNNNGFKATENVVNNIHKLNKNTGKTYSLKEIGDLFKNQKSLDESSVEMKYINKIGNELKNQEIGQIKVNNNEPILG